MLLQVISKCYIFAVIFFIIRMSKEIKIISRQCPLALLQVEELWQLINNNNLTNNLKYEVIKVDSYGDKHKNVSLMDSTLASDFFTRELDNALLNGTADIAVHSAKDLPYPLPAGIELLALTKSDDKSDSLVSRHNIKLSELPSGSRIGTSSLQRKAELLALRPDISVIPIRGTIEERIEQVKSGYIDALIVATCALKRLGLSHIITEILPFKTHPLQGNLAVTGRTDSPYKDLFSTIDVRKQYGKVTLVGFGPGDPELLTIKGLNRLKSADIIYYDDLTNADFLEQFQAEKVYVGKRSGKHSANQDEINELLYTSAIQSKKVVRLKGGDPMIFAHGREEIDFLKSRFIEVEVVPGISSGNALASLTQIPLTHRGLARSVAFVLGHSQEPQTPNTDTLIYYMGGAKISIIAERLLKSGRKAETPVALVTNVSLPNQHIICSTLGELRWAIYHETPVLIVVGEVVNFVAKSIYSKTYNTGTQSDTPLITIKKNDIPLPQAQAFDWIIFTSRYGVRYYNVPWGNTHIASVGPITSEELRQKGAAIDFESPTQSAEGLIQFFTKQPPCRILLPRSDKGLKELSASLEKQGHQVTDLPVYTNRPNTNATKVNLEEYDKVIFTSPTTVEAFKNLYNSQNTNHLLIIAKGKTTYEAIQTI